MGLGLGGEQKGGRGGNSCMACLGSGFYICFRLVLLFFWFFKMVKGRAIFDAFSASGNASLVALRGPFWPYYKSCD